MEGVQAIVVRTAPNDSSKRHRSYGPEAPPPYFTANFMRAIVEAKIDHLVCDLPSVDRAEDEGRLTAHRIFWGLAPGAASAERATRPDATITELAFIDNAIADGLYLLNLQIPPFEADAAPSRPLLFPLLLA
jgi:arylformamidase